MDRIMRLTVLLVCSLAWLSALLIFCATDASGQAVSATLFGRVTDASGGSIAKATVSVLNSATGFSRSAQTSDGGEYTIPVLPAGDYAVTVVFSGFGKQTKNITLQVGQSAALDFALSPGEVAQKVEFEATSE